MQTTDSNGNSMENQKAYRRFAAQRVMIALALTILLLVGGTALLNYFNDPGDTRSTVSHVPAHENLPEATANGNQPTHSADPEREVAEPVHLSSAAAGASHSNSTTETDTSADHDTGKPSGHDTVSATPQVPSHTVTETHAVQSHETVSHAPNVSADTPHASVVETAAQSAHAPEPVVHVPKAKGVTFVEATIQPLDYELNHRFWGWRPNDLIPFTDNVNNFQLGVLEVTRRTAVILAERISRIGSAAAFDPNLERAMNWFMIKADRYWFPSAESKYEEGLQELRSYIEKLERQEGSFYTRADSLIPLLLAYEDLLGSCDENLVKEKDESGLDVSFFKSDDFFYYARGVASAMEVVLGAVHTEFHEVIQSRNGLEALHHAQVSLQRATEIDPWIILDSDLSSIFANHRANMAAPISHARFYIGVLIKVLST